MSGTRRPLLADLKAELAALAADLAEMLTLRWQLARLELESDARTAKGLAPVLAVAAVMGLTALPLLAVCTAKLLEDTAGIPFAGWLAIFGCALLLGSAAMGLWVWRRFRRQFLGLRETLEELREDVVWLREWAGKADGDGDVH